MTYHPANGMMLSYGNWREGLPRVQCDGCDFVGFGVKHDGLLCAWLKRGKAPPGWLRVGKADFCRVCRLRVEGLS